MDEQPAVEGQFTYQDFDLLIEPGQGGSHRARVLRSPAGESAVVQFTLPFSPVEVENFVLKVGQPRRRTRGPGRPESAPLKVFGGKLYDAVFQHEVRDILERSLTLSRAQGAGMRLRLRLRDTPDLAELPWEFLYDPRRNRFLAQSWRTPLVRYLDFPDPPDPLAVNGPLRLLVVISNPSGYPALNAEREWSLLSEALAQQQADGRVIVERLSANMSMLQDRLSHGGFHVFHFVGHGFYRPDWEDGVLVMEDRNGRPQEVTGEDLGVLLTDYGLTRLAVLNACEGARSGASDPFAGTAQSLIQQGIPAVVAMQFEITDDAAIIFARELYTAIAYGYPLEAALAQARRAILYEGNPTEWGTPVLYSRAPDGRLFDLPRRAPAPGVQRSAEEEEAADRQAQETADRQAREAAERQAEELAFRYVEADAAANAGDWDRALTVFTALADLDPGYRDVSERLVDTRTQQQIAALRAEVRRLHQAGQWAAVVEMGQQLCALDPAAADPDGLVTEARAALADAERTERLDSGYQTALRQVGDGNLEAAIGTLELVVGLAPSGHPAVALLDQVRRQRQRPETSPRVLDAGRTVRAVAFSPDGAWLATGGRGTVRLWSLQTAATVPELPIGRRDTVTALAFSADSTQLTCGASRKARIWDVTTRSQQVELALGGSAVLAVAFSPDGTRLATGCDYPYAQIWDTATGQQELALPPPMAAGPPVGVFAAPPPRPGHGKASAVAFSPDGTRLAVGRGGTVLIWSLQTAAVAQELPMARREPVVALAFSPDSTRLAAGAGDTARIWDATTGEQQLELTHDGYQVLAVAFSPDGTQIATGSSYRHARIWNATNGRLQLDVTHGQSLVLAVAFSPDGTRLATGASDNTARIWNITDS